jgi:hypothetical protein
MIDRIVEIANPARLSIRDAQLVIERPKEEQLTLPFTTPVSEIAVLLLAHPQISLSQAVLSRIAELDDWSNNFALSSRQRRTISFRYRLAHSEFAGEVHRRGGSRS